MTPAPNDSSIGWRLAATALLLGALAMPLLLLRSKSVTLDEVAHVAAGYSYLETHEIVLNPMHPPLVKELCALPLLWLGLKMPAAADEIRTHGTNIFSQWDFGFEFLRSQGVQRVLGRARPVAVLLSLGLASIILLWGTELWGPAGGVLSLFLYVFDPTIAAHAQLVTTDVPFAFFATLFLYWLRSAMRLPSWGRVLRAGLGLGLVLAAKFSGVVLLPISVVLITLSHLEAPPAKGSGAMNTPVLRLLYSDRTFDRLMGSATVFGVMVLVAGALVWAAYFFPTDISFYTRGLTLVQVDHSPRYYHFFMGEFSKGTWPSYFLVAWLVKTPLPELAVIGASVVLFATGQRAGWFEEALLLIPLVFLFGGYSQLADPIGVRYLIPCYPLLYLFAGRAAALLSRSIAARAGLSAILVWSVFEFVAIWPDHLSYFNEAAGGWRGGIHWLDDSSVDWGQGLLELRDYVRERSIGNYTLCTVGNFDPQPYYGMHANVLWVDKLIRPPSGVLIMSSHCVARLAAVLDIQFGDQPENWLARTVPKDFVAHTYWVFEIPPATSS
jgi:hypothetical protein